MNVTLAVVLGVLNVPLYLMAGKLFFGDWDGFMESVRFWLTPDFLSWIRGEYWEDEWHQLKLGAWAACCGITVLGEYQLFARLLHLA